ncbi:hypothetical protein ACGFIK_27735 [Micromonospora sp. NPDC048871]|uniref:hypothetical protein n=1 Tax=unclassified Micromonospora TaxID=2617518 RepID=UPI002E124803|nr:hypothetical protein OIE53_10235 [Micromonospora sp. NBC_01739]
MAVRLSGSLHIGQANCHRSPGGSAFIRPVERQHSHKRRHSCAGSAIPAFRISLGESVIENLWRGLTAPFTFAAGGRDYIDCRCQCADHKMIMWRGNSSQPRLVTAMAMIMILVSTSSGCGPAAKAIGTIALEIGKEVVVSFGADYIRKILSKDEAEGQPTVVVSHGDAAGNIVGELYVVLGTNRITVDVVQGNVRIVLDGNGVALAVAPGAVASIEINADGGGQAVTSSAEDQAVLLDNIIKWSGRSRSLLFDALADLESCRNPAGATDDLREVADGRIRQIEALEELDVSALPKGAALRKTLVEALRHSLQADDAFVRWGEYVQLSGCRKGADWHDGMSYSREATAAKKKFVKMWRPVAVKYGLTIYREHQV